MPCIVIASRRSNLGRNVWVSCRQHGKSEHSNLIKSANGKLQGEAGGNFVVTSTTQVSEQNTHPSTCFSSEVWRDISHSGAGYPLVHLPSQRVAVSYCSAHQSRPHHYFRFSKKASPASPKAGVFTTKEFILHMHIYITW